MAQSVQKEKASRSLAYRTVRCMLWNRGEAPDERLGMGRKSRAFDPASLGRTILFLLHDAPRDIEALVNAVGQTYEGITPTSVKYVVQKQAKEKFVKRQGELYGLTKRGIKRVEYLRIEGFTPE